MKIILPMLAMLMSGLALGGSGSTLYWSGQVNRQFRAQKEWAALVDKQSVILKEQSAIIKEQNGALRNLTNATGELIEATRRPR